MTLSVKTVWFLICCVTSSSAADKRAIQYCGDQKFYCPTTEQCLDRNERCTASKVCVDSQGKEDKCFESSTVGFYNYYRKESPLSDSSSSSSRKKRNIFRHWFVEYRGFVYEFGQYGFQELDLNDPNYKYGTGGHKVVYEDLVGTSSCTRSQVISFCNDWLRANPKYDLFDSNCQHFVKKLIKELGNHCSGRVRRQDDDDEDSFKADCPMESSGSTLALSWKRFAWVGPLIAFATFYTN